MHLRGILLPGVAALCLIVSAPVNAQQDSRIDTTHSGDEAEMSNKARQRDQQAIDEAVKGWWSRSMTTHDQRIQWWKNARFGMFIHWGIYSLPGGEWHGHKVGGYAEHLMRKEKISRAAYLEVAHQFDPIRFNADEWVRAAKYAGMNYLIITSKHHDGFAMYNSDVSDFNIMKQTAWKHDPMMDLAAACRKYGVRFGFYYSHAFDWEHPEAPGNDWEYNNPGGDKNLFGGATWYDAHPELLPRAIDYVNRKAIPQIQELIRKYHPDILWFDTPGKLPLSENIRILKAIRETDPNVVVNGRLARDGHINFGDYKNTADRPAEFFPVEGDWEAIPTTNESYGYSKYDSSHKPVRFFIQLLAKAASRGGNLLLNIGPMGNGAFDPRDSSILHGIGDWISSNQSSIYRTTASGLPLQSWGVMTARNKTLYLHVFDWPSDGRLYLGGLRSAVAAAYLLKDASRKPLRVVRTDDKTIYIRVPDKAPDTSNTVIVLQLREPVRVDTVRYIAPNASATRLLAYDASLQGGGFGFGDGKTDRYYVDGWKSDRQRISWTFRTSGPATFKLIFKYLAGEGGGGAYQWQIDNYRQEDMVNAPSSGTSANASGSSVTTREAAVVTLPAGVHTLTITPTHFGKGELMRLLEAQLLPLHAQ